MMRQRLNQWSVLQDIHNLGEALHIYEKEFRFDECAHLVSSPERLPRLGALQVVLSDRPYYGRELRYFNQAPWWYVCHFDADQQENIVALLRFQSVDYYCKVYLNGVLVGEHEGYFEPFEFDVTHLLQEKDNLLWVKVWAPWDHEILPRAESMRCFSVKREMVKGTYEHADGFIQRDVNPVGIMGDVELCISQRFAFAQDWNADVQYHPDEGWAEVTVSAKVLGSGNSALVQGRILDQMGMEVARAEQSTASGGAVCLRFRLDQPTLWQPWERGEPYLYTVRLTLMNGTERLDGLEKRIGVREVRLERTHEMTRFFINGQAIFLRGTSYFGDVYLSELDFDRYYRDLRMIRDLGCNCVRVHVHVEKEAFYEICDSLGLLVIQDSDFNWDHPTDEKWMERAAAIFGAMVRTKKDHPSILCWVALNEPDLWKIFTHGLLEQTPEDQIMLDTLCVKLMNELKHIDPERPYIRASREEDDLESGDSHTYTGSLAVGTAYPQIQGQTEKLNTEFGMDVPGNIPGLFRDRRIFEALHPVLGELAGYQEYQYRLLSYYIDHYRAQKYTPCSGCIQFMFIDLCPQSFYGVLDFHGVPKRGYYAMLEAFQPLSLLARQTEEGFRILLVNDLLRSFQGTVSYSLCKDGMAICSGAMKTAVGADTSAVVGEVQWAFDPQERLELRLHFAGEDGTSLAERTYRDVFYEFPGMAGQSINNELGMRTYYFDEAVKERARTC